MSANASTRYQYDERVRDVDERSKEENRDNSALVEKMVTALNKQTAVLAPITGITKMYTKSHMDSLNKANTQAGFTQEQLKQLDEINSINKASNSLSLEGSPYAKYLGEIAGALGVVQQIASSKTKAKEQTEISDNLTKSIYHLQNGGKFSDISGALGAGTAKSFMGAAGTVSAGSWLHDMATTGQISGLTSGSLAVSNPGLLLSSLAGGMDKLGNATGAVGAGALSGAADLTGSNLLGKGASALSNLDPTTATILGTATMIGASIGANKMLNSMIKNSPLTTNKRQNRWNLSHSTIRATDNPIAMSNYIQSNNILRQLSNQNILSPGESQMLGKLNEIAFYTSILQEMFETGANRDNLLRNHSTGALNKIDKDQITRDVSGNELQNLFNNGKLSKNAVAFLKHNEGLKYLADTFNIGTYIKSLSGKDTAPNQFKLREALQQGDPEAAKKSMARDYGITIADVNLLHADMKERIANASTSYEGRLLASGVYTNMLLQLVASKVIEQTAGGSKGNKNLIGALEKLQEEQNKKFQKNQDMFIDGMVKPFMQSLSKIPILSATVPALQAGTYLTKSMVKGVSGLSNFIANPLKSIQKLKNSAKDTFQEMKDNAIDNLKIDSVKNEKSIRNQIGANALSLQDQANMYIARYLPQDMQKLQWLLGSKESAKVQDRYTGEFVTPEELKNRYSKMATQIKDLTTQTKEAESYLDEFKNWGTKKLFGIKPEDIRVASHTKYSHVNDILRELRVKKIRPDLQTDDLEFALDPNNIGQRGTTLNSSLNFLTNQIKRFGTGNTGINSRQDKYFDLMDKYIPLLQEIRDCVCTECECGNDPDVPGGSMSKTLSKAFKRKRFSIDPTPGPSDSANAVIPYQSLSMNPFNISKTFRNKITSQSMEDNVKRSQQEELMNKFFDTYFKQLPYLEKIHKHLTKKEIVSGYKPFDPNKGDGLMDLISGVGGFLSDSVLDMFGFGEGRGKKGPKNPKSPNGLPKLSAGNLSGGLMRIAATLAKPGPLAIGGALAAISAAGIDYFFNDGKMLTNAWNSLKESAFGQSISGLWESMKEFFLNFPNIIGEAISNAWNGGKEKVGEAVNNFFGISSISSDQIKSELDNKKSTLEKLSYLEKNKDKISSGDLSTYRDSILEAENAKFMQTWNMSLDTPYGAEAFVKDKFKSLSLTDRIKFAEDMNNNLASRNMVYKMGSAMEEQYSKINNQIANSIKESTQDTRSKEEKDNAIKELTKELKSINSASVNNTEAINKIVEQTVSMNALNSKSLVDQINALSNTQAGIANMLNVTAKFVQKPNIIELDRNVISVLPILKG